MGCFWTDFVGCAEDCGDAPPVNNRVALIAYFSTSGDFPIQVKIFDTAFPQEGGWSDAESVPFTAGGFITEGHLYVQNSSGCDWKDVIPSANGEADGSNVFTADGEKTFASVASLAALADVDGELTAPVAIDTSGQYVRSDLYTACGIDPGAGNSFVFVGKVTNTATGLEYIGSGQKNTCF